MRAKTRTGQENISIRTSVCLLLTTAMLLSGHPVVAQDSKELRSPSDNAALNYYQAFMWYGDTLQPEMADSDDGLVLWSRFPDGNYNEETDKVFRLADRFLREMRRGSRKPVCFWGAEVFNEDGLYINVLSGCKSLAWIVSSRARYYGSIGNTAEALEDFRAVCRLAGNFEGEHRTLIGLLIRNAMYATAMMQAAHILPALSVAELDQLSAFWRSQRENFVWDYGARLKWEIDLVGSKVMLLPEGDPVARLAWLGNHGFSAKSKFLAGLKTKGDFENAVGQYREFTKQAARVADIREYDGFEVALKALVDERGNADRLGACDFINETELRRNYLKFKRIEVMMAMFQQALNIYRDGFEGAATVSDPFNQTAFKMEKSETEFVLKSDVPKGDGTLEMRFPIKK